MNFNKMQSLSRVFRVVVGIGLVGYAIASQNSWFYLGVIPLFMGICNVCPLCMFSKKCDINEN